MKKLIVLISSLFLFSLADALDIPGGNGSGSGGGSSGGGVVALSLNDAITGASEGPIYFGGVGGTLAQTSTFTLTSAGRFGVGTASPSSRLHFKYPAGTGSLVAIFDTADFSGAYQGTLDFYQNGSSSGQKIEAQYFGGLIGGSISLLSRGLKITGAGSNFLSLTSQGIGFNTETSLSAFSVKGGAVIGSGYNNGSFSVIPASAPANGLLVEGVTGIGTPTPDLTTKLHVSSGTVLINGTGAGLNVVGTSSATFFVGNGSLLTNLPAGAGDMILASTQTVTAAKTFSAPTVFSSSVSLTNTGTTNGFSMQQIGNTPVNAGGFGTGRGMFYLDNTQNTGIGLHAYTNQAAAAGLGVLARFDCANASYTQPCVQILQAGTSGAAAGIRMDGVAPQIEFIESDQSTPAGKYELGVNGDLFYVDGRNAADSSFENIWRVARKGLGAINGHYVANMSTAAYRFYDADNSNYVSIKASDTITSNVNWTLPASDVSGYLKSNGSGALSISAAGDSLGNHTATTTVDMAGFGLINVASITMTPAAIVQASTFTSQTFITSPDGGVTNSTWTLYTTSATLAQGGATTVATYLGSDIDLSGAEATGILAAGRFPALTGDITTSAGALATVLASTVPGVHFFSGATLNTSTAGITVQGAATSSLSSAVSVLSTATANGTAGGGLMYVGRQGTSALSSSQMGQIVFVGGDGSVANGPGVTLNAKAAGTWNSGSHRSHFSIGTAANNSIDSESYDFGIQDTGQVTIGTTTISAGTPAGTGLLTLGGKGDMPQIAMTGSAGEPSGLVSGGIYYNTNQKAIRYMVQGTSETFTGGLWTKTVPSTVTATTTETDLLGTGFGTLLLPANFWVAGKTIRVHLEGLISDDAATPGTHTFAAKLDAVSIAATAANTPTVGLTNKHWDMDVTLTCRSTGASGVVVGAGSFRYENTLAAGYWGLTKTEATLATVDTTQADTLAVTLTNGTNDADNIFVTQAATVEVLN